jgi:glycine/D-amino acid oxidase-like deaminating enzyme
MYVAMTSVVVAGAGIFGVTAAIELRRRGHSVQLLDPGPLPRPLAASTDISKVVRIEYGADEDYTALAEKAIDGWRRWNRDFGVPLYHETGLLMLRPTPLARGTVERDSFDVISRRGHRPETLDAAAVSRRFPAWNANAYRYGTYNPEGGFVESGRAVARLVQLAAAIGVEIHEGVAVGALETLTDGRRPRLTTSSGQRFEGDLVILALGAWTPHAIPWLASELRSTGHPIVHFRPADPEPFRPERFPVFCADISTTGYYGFPVHPIEGVVKIARHGLGRVMHPESARVVTAEEIADARAFVAATFPLLAASPIVFSGVCLYCDSWDGHFWIAHDPDRPGVVVATGDSGHAFKFGPVLGSLVADVAEGRADPLHEKFRWRPGVRPRRSEEAMRLQR